jgi:hypothetical protein
MKTSVNFERGRTHSSALEAQDVNVKQTSVTVLEPDGVPSAEARVAIVAEFATVRILGRGTPYRHTVELHFICASHCSSTPHWPSEAGMAPSQLAPG